MSSMMAEIHWGKQSRSLNDGIIFQIDVKFQNNFIKSLSRIQGSGTCVFLELASSPGSISWSAAPEQGNSNLLGELVTSGFNLCCNFMDI
jgi:hypothetical protein